MTNPHVYCTKGGACGCTNSFVPCNSECQCAIAQVKCDNTSESRAKAKRAAWNTFKKAKKKVMQGTSFNRGPKSARTAHRSLHTARWYPCVGD